MSVYNDGTEGNPKWQNYATHLFGAAQYAESVGPTTLDTSQAFDRKLLMWLRFQSLFVCVAKRKRFFWDRPEWRLLENGFERGGSRDWYPLLVPLPGTLEKADVVLTHLDKQSQIRAATDLCHKLDDFRESLLNWIETDFAGRPGIAAVTDLEAFDMEIEEHCFMSTSSTFTTFHTFADAAHAMRCATSWFMSLISDCTLLRLLHTYPEASLTFKRSMHEVERKAHEATRNICRSVYYYSTLNSMAYAYLLWVWIDLAQAFFEEIGSMKEVGWCQACLIAIHMRMVRVRPVRRATLCRVGDLHGAFTDACRYRTRPEWPVRQARESPGS